LRDYNLAASENQLNGEVKTADSARTQGSSTDGNVADIALVRTESQTDMVKEAGRFTAECCKEKNIYTGVDNCSKR
jgi:hypothetical protein